MFKYLKPVWNRWVGLGAILVAGAICGVVGLVLMAIQPQTEEHKPRSIFLTIIPAPSQTPVINLSASRVTPTKAAVSLPVAGIRVGLYVQITGTGGDGLRLRAGPGINFKLNVVGMEQEVFHVTEGPTEGDGFTWWYLVAPYDSSRGGWAASNYLFVIEQPR